MGQASSGMAVTVDDFGGLARAAVRRRGRVRAGPVRLAASKRNAYTREGVIEGRPIK